MSLSNNLLRIIVSLLAIPLIIAASVFGSYYFFVFVAAISLVAYFEMHQMFKKKAINTNLIVGLLLVLFFIFNQFILKIDAIPVLMAFIVILSIIELFRNNGSAVSNIGATLLASVYLGLAAAALIGIREFFSSPDYYRGGLVIISLFVSIWICDSAAYYGGTALGKHKLFPRVSPNKSWEGAIFGFIFSVIGMIVLKFVWLDFLSLQSAAFIGIVTGTIGQLGDLFESLIKRDSGVKDSSNLIPGHGGIFDRFDSLFLSAPVIFLYLKYVIW